jgi:hypothetical protein
MANNSGPVSLSGSRPAETRSARTLPILVGGLQRNPFFELSWFDCRTLRSALPSSGIDIRTLRPKLRECHRTSL